MAISTLDLDPNVGVKVLENPPVREQMCTTPTTDNDNTTYIFIIIKRIIGLIATHFSHIGVIYLSHMDLRTRVASADSRMISIALASRTLHGRILCNNSFP